ncbi:hypothetical protein [Flavobacterium sp.]|uniref:hypothetical protein n=1 Tax=Flavobacterium sp. TaxID=239 RepID=UPI004034942F
MKQLFLIVLIALSFQASAQKKLPIIKAASPKAGIYEKGKHAVEWTLTPEAKPDVYVTNKLAAPAMIMLKTDSDSIAFRMKPGQRRDFIVLLNGKDSCYTSFQSPVNKDLSKIKPAVHDTIPFVMNSQNTIYVKAILNATDTLSLNFDTGTTELVLTKETLKNKIRSGVKLYNTPQSLKIGSRDYSVNAYDAEKTGHDTDGRFGWDLFDGMIVELNYDRRLMIVHSEMPKSIKKNKGYAKLNITYFSHIFFVEGTLIQSGRKNTDLFLFDTGYQRTAMLDNDLLKQNGFPAEKMEVIKKVVMYGAQGNEVPVITSNLEALKLGKYTLPDVPAQLLTTNKPLRGANIHLLGNEVLKRFNIVLDFQENIVYLKPNVHFTDVYIEKG